MFHISTFVRGMAEVQKCNSDCRGCRVATTRTLECAPLCRPASVQYVQRWKIDGNQTVDRRTMGWGIGFDF